MNLVSLLAGYISMRKYRQEFYKPSLFVVSSQFACILLVRRHRKHRSATGRDLTVICSQAQKAELQERDRILQWRRRAELGHEVCTLACEQLDPGCRLRPGCGS